jgi:hypothetical protein
MSLTKVSFSMIDGSVGNVKDFGAKIDGATNDVTAINDAIDASASTFIPSGVCLIEDSIVFPVGGRLLNGTQTDQNNSANRIEYDGPDSTSAIQLNTASSLQNIAVTDISGGTNNTGIKSVDGNGGHNLNAVSATGFRIGMNLTNTYYNTLIAPFCRNSTQVGFFQGASVYHTSIINLSVNNSPAFGLVPTGIQIASSQNVTYINPSVEGTNDVALRIDASAGLSIKDVYFENNNQLIYIGPNAANVVIDGVYMANFAGSGDSWSDMSLHPGKAAAIEIASCNNICLKNFKWVGATDTLKNRLFAYTGSITSGDNRSNGLIIGRGWGSSSAFVQNQGALRNLIKLQPDLIRFGYLDMEESAVDYEVTDARVVTTTADQRLVRNPSRYNNQLHARVFLTTESQIVLSGGEIEIYAGYNTASNADIAYYYSTANIPASSNIVMWDPMTIANDTNNVFSPDRLWLTGVTNTNSDETTLYWENTFDGGTSTRTVNLYKSSAGGAGELVASGSTTTAGALTLPLTQQNASGISGACKLTATTTATALSASNTIKGNNQLTVGPSSATNAYVFGNTAGTSGQYRLMPVFTNY